MQIDLSAALGFFATFLSMAIGIIVAIGRIAIANREKEIDRRLGELAKATTDTADKFSKLVTDIDLRLHVEEKATIRQDGDVNRVRDALSSHIGDIEEIKRLMVTKSEFAGLEKQVGQVLVELRGISTRYRSGPLTTPSPPPFGKPGGRP